MIIIDEDKMLSYPVINIMRDNVISGIEYPNSTTVGINSGTIQSNETYSGGNNKNYLYNGIDESDYPSFGTKTFTKTELVCSDTSATFTFSPGSSSMLKISNFTVSSVLLYGKKYNITNLEGTVSDNSTAEYAISTDQRISTQSLTYGNEISVSDFKPSNISSKFNILSYSVSDSGDLSITLNCLPSSFYYINGKLETSPLLIVTRPTLTTYDAYRFDVEGILIKLGDATVGTNSSSVIQIKINKEDNILIGNQGKNVIYINAGSAINNKIRIPSITGKYKYFYQYMYDKVINGWGRGKISVSFDCVLGDYTDDNGICVAIEQNGVFFKQGDIFKINPINANSRASVVQGILFEITNCELKYNNGEKYIHIDGREFLPKVNSPEISWEAAGVTELYDNILISAQDKDLVGSKIYYTYNYTTSYDYDELPDFPNANSSTEYTEPLEFGAPLSPENQSQNVYIFIKFIAFRDGEYSDIITKAYQYSYSGTPAWNETSVPIER